MNKKWTQSLPSGHGEEGSWEEAEVVHRVEAVPKSGHEEDGNDGETLGGAVVDAFTQPARGANIPVIEHQLCVGAQLKAGILKEMLSSSMCFKRRKNGYWEWAFQLVLTIQDKGTILLPNNTNLNL